MGPIPAFPGLKYRHRLALILVLLSYISPSLQFTHYVADPNSCIIIGDTDVYGIGVRLSYYLAFWAGIIAMLANHKSAVRDVRKGVNIISCAVFITVVRNTVQGSFALFEWYIVFPMVFLPVISLPTLEPHEILKGLGSMGVWMVLYGVYSVLLPWIWWIKLYQGSRPHCHPQVLIYAFFDLYNPHYVTFGKVISIIGCITGAVMLVSGIFLIIAAAFSAAKIEDAVTSFLKELSGNSHQEVKDSLQGSNIVLAIASAFSGISLVVFTELELRRNKVDLSDSPLTSTSQLVPFLVGLFTFISTVWSVTTEKKEERGANGNSGNP